MIKRRKIYLLVQPQPALDLSKREGKRELRERIKALAWMLACAYLESSLSQPYFSSCIKFHLFPCQIFLYRDTNRTLTRKAAAEHGEDGISRPWESIKEGNSIGAKAVIYDVEWRAKKSERNECDHKQVFKVTFSWEINWNLWSSGKSVSPVMFLCDILHAILDEMSELHDKLNQFD